MNRRIIVVAVAPAGGYAVVVVIDVIGGIVEHGNKIRVAIRITRNFRRTTDRS